MYDPFQSYQTSGPYYGIQSPIGSPFAAVQPQVTAAAAVNPLAAILASQATQQAYGGLPIQNLLGQVFGQQPQFGQQLQPFFSQFGGRPLQAPGISPWGW
jgi:hypothetical protein